VELRKKLGLAASGKIALLVGGGEGMGPLIPTLHAVKDSGVRCQIVVICGKNVELQRRISKMEWGPELIVLAQGFVKNMDEWMGACDCIVTKAGPGTIAEALICGLPILLNGFIPCQEEGNIPYVQNARVGTFKSAPKDVAETLKHWFSPDFEGELAAMAERARDIAKPQATYDISRSLVELLESRTGSAKVEEDC
jgi:1,2-diacylglycerol 3-beta-galactosyltransferase